MLDDKEDNTNVRIGRGRPIENDGLWLSANDNPATVGTYNEGESKYLASEFGLRRTLLATHLMVFRERGINNVNY
jgi:hypothetical protein